MEKKPLIPIDQDSLDIWYESPSVMIVKKPKGILTHPKEKSENGTLLNRLFQHNRWLAEMETSVSAGVLHVFDENDHGLMLFNKSDEYSERLNRAITTNDITFSYIVTLKGEQNIKLPVTQEFEMKLNTEKQFNGHTILDLQVNSGDTWQLRERLFPNIPATDVSFYCYQIDLTLPHIEERHSVSLRDYKKGIPDLVVYHAPP
ncbi:pseudouridine synthase [Aquibacillus sp. 3ASR75-11]|uniref:Pseudouridine synthase n=1 Tax=Terrihalobacillus insolitus TaxID=2950438 RepID=A0A9X4ALD2_9BACI|nr:pseudouridine synthase [Terrihalobacillus insolitus]MDC3412870.1 pseudouridine synthase [Terrihalobacillus insolitus]MDC3423654.1 pseudouridine synthase [Terrihalobacillus insolitus]